MRRWFAHKKRAYHARFQWRIAWDRLPTESRSWAHQTSACESGHNPTAHNPGGQYHGAFQFSLPTARAAGFAGDPHNVTYLEQAVRAVRWRNVAGRGQWPVCG